MFIIFVLDIYLQIVCIEREPEGCVEEVGGLRMYLLEDQRACLTGAAWLEHLSEVTDAFCSLHSFTLASFEGSSHGSFNPNNDITRACRKEDLCGILFPCAA